MKFLEAACIIISASLVVGLLIAFIESTSNSLHLDCLRCGYPTEQKNVFCNGCLADLGL